MDTAKIKKLLKDVKSGKLSTVEAFSKLKHLPYEDIGHAKVDHHRNLRKGFPEVIYCEGKTIPQIVEIAKKLSSHNDKVMATRADNRVFRAVKKALPKAKYHEMARIITVAKPNPQNSEGRKQSIDHFGGNCGHESGGKSGRNCRIPRQQDAEAL